MTATLPSILAPPRPITSTARRRAWAEPGVRLWWMSAIAVTLVIVYLVASRALEHLQRAALLEEGIAVTAHIEQIVGRHQQTRATPVPVRLRYALPDGRQFIDTAVTPLEATSNEDVLHVDDPLPIRVDPQNPARWTEDRPPRSFFASIGIAAALLPLVILLFLLAWMKRRSVLAVWRNGEATQAAVLGQKASALAPRSQLLSISLANDPENRVVSLLHPRKVGELSKGDSIVVVAPPGKPQKAVEASLYEARDN